MSTDLEDWSAATEPTSRAGMSIIRTAGTTESVGTDLVRLLKALKLGALADTLPERTLCQRRR